ncbi:MAG: hypothetical protein CAF44_014080 [Nitrospira sp. CG24D]|nr:MAG: hypothetical protein CAF44_014080 [Nitrospira sp. CG24D]
MMTNEPFRLLLEAEHPEKGLCGLTRSDAGQDVFGQWSIDVSGGRIGRRGRSVTDSAAENSGLLSAVGPPARMGSGRLAAAAHLDHESCHIRRTRHHRASLHAPTGLRPSGHQSGDIGAPRFSS